MLRRTMAEFDIKAGLQHVLQRIDEEIIAAKPILVAVSKTKPAEAVIEAYNAGQRHFGENYVQELVEKSQHPDILSKCPEIKWHFIGHLQSNKINKILKLPNLHMIQTVDSKKLATSLEGAWSKLEPEDKEPLRVLIQINTSGEEAKSGISPSEAPTLYNYIRTNLKNLQLAGIMTIGAYGFDYSTGPNPDFVSLMAVHNSICRENNLPPESVQVSMGMSNDYEKAIEMGSSIVRVGTSIFGYRAAKA
ncbi:pyridoxal phosphate homeostasis protein isoform X2 [Scaptodrosophila lebanonensis]|uniref:Pyridoxal phosphate homeostasis protein n=1 Tax=Drosophila lebanonensis TaxID=7225 RepID=A0A6J2T4A4_DROLE|nr:pyridoxal phosphate homeostasis protein isoform X2 [Scaptodrosophila lebanonensis]